MRRNSKDPKEEITLFIGGCRLIVLNSNRQIDFATRTILLTETTLFTYNIQNLTRSRTRSEIKDSVL